MLGGILLYAALGEIIRPTVRMVDPATSYLFTTMGVAVVGVIFVVRRTLVFRAAESLVTQPDDKLSLNHWKTGYLATYALCEALALFGFVQRFLGSNFQQSLPLSRRICPHAVLPTSPTSNPTSILVLDVATG